MKTLSPQMQRIEAGLTALVLDQPFFAVLAMKLEQIETFAVPTFATDGRRLLINPEFAATLSDKEIVTVLAHEVMHCAMCHLWRMPEGGDHKTWNLAIDNETNWELEEVNQEANRQGETIPFPWPACGKEMQDRFRGMAAEFVYNILMQEKKEEEDQPKSKKGQKSPEQNSGFGDVLPGQKDDEELKEQWERALVQAVSVGKTRGHIPGAIKELVEKITSTKIDWKSLLRDYLYTIAKEDWSFRKYNARYADTDFSLPSLYSEKAGHIVFAIDTSGSIDTELLKEFVAEAQLALDDLNPESLTLIYCDAEIQHSQVYLPGDTILPQEVGRGGTDFRPVFEHCSRLDNIPTVLIYLTDLMGQFPEEEPEFKTLWVTTTKGGKAPVGEVIEV